LIEELFPRPWAVKLLDDWAMPETGIVVANCIPGKIFTQIGRVRILNC